MDENVDFWLISGYVNVKDFNLHLYFSSSYMSNMVASKQIKNCLQFIKHLQTFGLPENPHDNSQFL